MACGGHIRHENYGFIGIEGPAPASAFGHGLDLHSRGLDPVAYGRHSLRTTLSGYISKFTYIGELVPSLIADHGQAFHPGSQRPMAQGDFTQGMASTGHIFLGNHETIHTNGSTPITSSYPVQADRVGSLGQVMEACPDRHLCHQRNATCQGIHE